MQPQVSKNLCLVLHLHVTCNCMPENVILLNYCQPVMCHVFAGLPVTIRLLDPPLHEFLPEGDIDEIVEELAEATGVKEEEVLLRIEKLSEVNPMLGFRGCR